MSRFNRPSGPSRPSRLARLLSATAALLISMVVLSSVAGLALHYEQHARMQTAATAPAGTGAAAAA